MQLKLCKTLKTKEIKKFGVPNTLDIHDFYGCQYAMCLCAIKSKNGKMEYIPEYSRNCINKKIPVNEILSFVELNKSIIHKEKFYDGGYFITVYYVVYYKEDKPSILNDFNNFSVNNVDIEIVFNENGYYRVDELHLQLQPYTSVIKAIGELFSNENTKVLSFIHQANNNQYSITYYDDLGQPKEFTYPSIESVYDRIISIRLIGCEEVDNE